jgi:hypothetical protein
MSVGGLDLRVWSNVRGKGILGGPEKVGTMSKTAKVSNSSEAEPILIKFHRHRYAQWAVLFDADLEFRSLEELRDWAERKIAFVVIDTETGDDITRILLA